MLTWFSGNSGSGKTTRAKETAERGGIVLNGED